MSKNVLSTSPVSRPGNNLTGVSLIFYAFTVFGAGQTLESIKTSGKRFQGYQSQSSFLLAKVLNLPLGAGPTGRNLTTLPIFGECL